MRVDAVDADPVDGDVRLLEIAESVPKLGKLASSTRGEIEDIEGDHGGATALDGFGKLDPGATGRGQLEVGCGVAYLEHPVKVTGAGDRS